MSAKKHPDRQLQVFLLIENRLLRETLVRLFRKLTDICLVGQSSLVDAIGFPEPACDIVVLDDLNTASMLNANLQAKRPEAHTMEYVVIGMEDEEEPFLAAVRCGVTAYLLNEASASDVVAAVRAVGRGEAVCPPRLCLALFRSVASTANKEPVPTNRGAERGLTLRQQQLISLVAKGLTNKEIASQLNLSEFTVKNHIHRIMRNMKAASRYKVAEAARASGYIGLTT